MAISDLLGGVMGGGSALGLSIGTSAIKLVELKKQGKVWKLLHFGIVQLPEDVIVNREIVNQIAVVDSLRTLLGGIPLLMPASIDVMTDDALRDVFQRWWKTPSIEAVERHKLYKLAWDIVGSEFAGRHMLYEKFYAGNSLVVRNQSDREAPCERFHATVDGLLARIKVPERR